MIQTCSHQAGESRHADDQKPFIVMARLSAAHVAVFQELLAVAVKIRLQEISGGQKASGDHEAKRRNGERPKMEKRNH